MQRELRHATARHLVAAAIVFDAKGVETFRRQGFVDAERLRQALLSQSAGRGDK